MPNHALSPTAIPVAMPANVEGTSLTVSLAPTPTRSADAQLIWCHPAPYTGRRMTADGFTAYDLIRMAFDLPNGRCLDLAGLPTTRFAVDITLPAPHDEGLRALLQATVLAMWGIHVRHESRVLQVGVLRVHDRQAVGFVRATHGRVACEVERGRLTGTGMTLAMMARVLEASAAQPFVDETGLPDHFDVDLTWPADDWAALVALFDARGVQLQWESRALSVTLIERAETLGSSSCDVERSAT